MVAATIAAATLVSLPAPYSHVVARVDTPLKLVCKDQLYEGNNLDLRGAVDKKRQIYARTGDESFAAWKAVATDSGGIFVLRDSLMGQQDHPYRQNAPRALLLPPNWITAAALGATAGPVSFPVEDDAAWTAVKSAKDMFGGMPASDALFEFASKSLKTASADELARVRNARSSVREMAQIAAPLLAAVAKGREKVIEEGARVIVESDERYFGKELREKKIIPIFVENPRRVELEEGKGFEPLPDSVLAPELRTALIRGVYGARLKAGDLAIERYDIRDAKLRQRAIEVAKASLEGAGSTHHKLWLWVTGKLDDRGELKGEDASAYVENFRKELIASGIDMSRVRLLSKPALVPPKGKDRDAWLKEKLARFEKLALPLSTVFNCEQLHQLSR